MSASDIKMSAFEQSRIGDALESATQSIFSLCQRFFYPLTTSRYFPYPNEQGARSGRLWLDQDLISITSFTSGGVTIPPSNYFLEPANSGPPYSSIEINRNTSSALSSNPGTSQRSLVITGVWGYSADEESAGTLVGSLASTTATMLTFSGDARVGIGSLLRIDSERMIVTGRAWTSSGQQGTLTASLAAQALAVTDGTQFTAGEWVLLDQERMQILEIIGNTLTVRRAGSGSFLAAHSAATIYTSRTLTVRRGALGTTAATHTGGAAIARHRPPGMIQKLAIAYAIDTMLQEGAGYARVSGEGLASRKAAGEGGSAADPGTSGGISNLEARVAERYGRRVRTRAV